MQEDIPAHPRELLCNQQLIQGECRLPIFPEPGQTGRLESLLRSHADTSAAVY